MNNATFALLIEINAVRAAFGFGPLSQYEFSTPSEWRAEHSRVMTERAANRCPW